MHCKHEHIQRRWFDSVFYLHALTALAAIPLALAQTVPALNGLYIVTPCSIVALCGVLMLPLFIAMFAYVLVGALGGRRGMWALVIADAGVFMVQMVALSVAFR